MSDISALIAGFSQFQREYTLDGDGKFKALLDFGQTPEIMMIACCDSRVDPAIITNSESGDILVVRNIANLVPPYSKRGDYREIHAAIEYGVCYLRVKHIIVMGHSRCGGIRSLMTRMLDEFDPSHPLDEWTSIAEPIAREVLDRDDLEDLNDKVCACSRETLDLCLKNLATYPWVEDAIRQERLTLHAWYFNLSTGALERYDPLSREFSLLS
ncbi:MAG: carbonic anhydrase [Pseudomonadota bacterium]